MVQPSAERPRISDRSPAGAWFRNFLFRELAPYPGRATLVARIVASTTLAMLVIMTFHIAGGALGGFFSLAISRESLRSTAQGTFLTIGMFGLGTVYVMVSVMLFLDSPVTHFLWVVGSLYGIFFIIHTSRNYAAAAGFSFLVATAIPTWDRPGDLNTKVSLTLVTLLSIIIGTFSTLLVEWVYRFFSTGDRVVAGVSDRLRVAGQVLRSLADGRTPDPQVEQRLLQYAMVGPSDLRQQVIRAGQTPGVRARSSAAIATSAWIVELCASALGQRGPASLEWETSERLLRVSEALAEQAARIAALPSIAHIGGETLPRWTGSEEPSKSLPVLPEIERTVSLLSDIANSFGVKSQQEDARQHGAEAVGPHMGWWARMSTAAPRSILRAAFVPEAFTDPASLMFALRGCLAATLCYLVYNGVDWPGINTSVATCIITALGTVGASRQKQLLRIAGAFAGGFLIALPAQVFLLPKMNSIGAFTLFFATVMAVAAWFSTASPRLSYFGWQLALAFYLVNLQEPFEQISLSVARDRVIGILLGLVAMWLVFDRIAAPRAIERMDTLMRSTLHMLGELASTIAAAENLAGARSRGRFQHLREGINNNFSQMNAEADAVHFEYGRHRERQLRERERMQNMQPAMRSLYLLEVSLWDAISLSHGSPVGGAKMPSSGPRSFAVLERLAEALDTLAALPVPHARTLPRYAGVQARADAAVDAVGRELEAMRGTPEQGRGTPASLCAGLVMSLRALQNATNTP